MTSIRLIQSLEKRTKNPKLAKKDKEFWNLLEKDGMSMKEALEEMRKRHPDQYKKPKESRVISA